MSRQSTVSKHQTISLEHATNRSEKKLGREERILQILVNSNSTVKRFPNDLRV